MAIDVEPRQESCGFAAPRHELVEPRRPVVGNRETESDKAIAAKGVGKSVIDGAFAAANRLRTRRTGPLRTEQANPWGERAL